MLLALILLAVRKFIRWQNIVIQLSCLVLGSISFSPISQAPLSEESVKCKNLEGQIVICLLKKQNEQQLNFITVLDDIKYIVYLKKQNVAYFPGDTLRIKKFNIKLITAIEILNNGYTEHLITNGIKGQIFLHQKDIQGVNDGHGLFRMAYKIRNRIIQQIQKEKVLSRAEQGVFYSLLLGERSYLQKDIREDFKESGIIHVLAISGLHVGILFLFIKNSLKLFRVNNRYIKLIIVVGILLFYSVIAGLSPSVVRAALMCTLIQIGLFLENKNVTLNIVLSSSLLLLLFKPTWLWDLGFQLSYMAVIFIVLVLNKSNAPIQNSSIIHGKHCSFHRNISHLDTEFWHCICWLNNLQYGSHPVSYLKCNSRTNYAAIYAIQNNFQHPLAPQ
jgi:ComEC/Rec2-related protein